MFQQDLPPLLSGPQSFDQRSIVHDHACRCPDLKHYGRCCRAKWSRWCSSQIRRSNDDTRTCVNEWNDINSLRIWNITNAEFMERKFDPIFRSQLRVSSALFGSTIKLDFGGDNPTNNHVVGSIFLFDPKVKEMIWDLGYHMSGTQ